MGLFYVQRIGLTIYLWLKPNVSKCLKAKFIYYSAPLSAFTSKASSGALELMDVYDVDNLANFLNCSSQNNWIIYGAVSNFNSNNSNKNSISINELNNPLSKHPVILVIGSEGKD